MTPEQIEKVKEMRERTSLSLMKCKYYLVKANWDLEEAMKLARIDTRESMKRFGGIMDG